MTSSWTALKFREAKLRKDPNCLACGVHRTITEQLVGYEAFCGIRRARSPAPAEVPEITPQELKTTIEPRKPLILLDVREVRNFTASPIRGARSIPLGELLYHLHEFTSAEEIVVCGGSDEQSREAAETLRVGNFRKTRILQGGYRAWKERLQRMSMRAEAVEARRRRS